MKTKITSGGQGRGRRGDDEEVVEKRGRGRPRKCKKTGPSPGSTLSCVPVPVINNKMQRKKSTKARGKKEVKEVPQPSSSTQAQEKQDPQPASSTQAHEKQDPQPASSTQAHEKQDPQPPGPGTSTQAHEGQDARQPTQIELYALKALILQQNKEHQRLRAQTIHVTEDLRRRMGILNEVLDLVLVLLTDVITNPNPS